MKKVRFQFTALVAIVATVLFSASVGLADAQQVCIEPADCRLEQPAAMQVDITRDAADVVREKVAKRVDRLLDRKVEEQQAEKRMVAAPYAAESWPIKGSTDYCTHAYSFANESYCDELTGSYVSRSSAAHALSCCRYAFDDYGNYNACTAALSTWWNDGNMGGGGGEGLRGRFTESSDGSVVVLRHNGKKLTFDVVTGACEPDNSSRTGAKTDYRQWSYETTSERRATSNFDHAPVVNGQPLAWIQRTVNTETVWGGFEICERDVGE